jgi:hypothetical protein
MAAEFHLAENALALHLFLQRLKGLVDVIVANKNLHASSFSERLAWCAFGNGIVVPTHTPARRGALPSRKPLESP